MAITPAAAAIAASMPTAHADPPGAAYIAAVQQAYNLVHGAPASDSTRADAAIRVLTDGTGDTQPEIIADLKARPPLYGDASTRLANLLAALGHPVTTADPDSAKQHLHDVLASDRYHALHSPPSLLDRFAQWVQDRIAELLRLLFGSRAGGSAGTSIWIYLVGAAIVGVALFMIFSAVRGRFSQPAAISPEGPRPAADYFADADRLAAKGDRVAAIRALCAAVAATLAGEGSWAGSPLTVREIFQKSSDFAGLRPLLIPFEAAVYGGRDVDQAIYDRAAKVADAYRRPVEKAA